MLDSLGDRMKIQYEDRTRIFLPRRTYTIIRLDGKAFHTYTRSSQKPFDYELMSALDQAAIVLAAEAMGVQFGYLQSDEMSFLLTDFTTIKTEAWFNGNLQKITSIAASIITSAFANTSYANTTGRDSTACFDARAFTIPDPTEVENYFIWRQKDAERNSISMFAQSLFSHRELHGKNQAQMQDMIHSKDQNWNDLPISAKRGRLLVKSTYSVDGSERTQWVIKDPSIFTQERITSLIPRIP